MRERAIETDEKGVYRGEGPLIAWFKDPAGQRAVDHRRGRGELTALDDLYREHPSEFVAARDELAKGLRSDGDREEADRVKKLKRPSAAAWLLNVVALAQPKPLRAFAKASQALEKAQQAALEGGDKEVEKWRAAAAREREAAQAVIDAAEKAAGDAGHPATKQALDLVDGTLRAAAADPELRERVVAGRLEREQAGATIGLSGPVSAAPKGRRGAPASARRGTPRKRREAAQAGRELKRVERALGEASDREERRQAAVDDATKALSEPRQRLKAAKSESADLRRQAKALERKTRRSAARADPLPAGLRAVEPDLVVDQLEVPLDLGEPLQDLGAVGLEQLEPRRPRCRRRHGPARRIRAHGESACRSRAAWCTRRATRRPAR